jgi:hypothetical protein
MTLLHIFHIFDADGAAMWFAIFVEGCDLFVEGPMSWSSAMTLEMLF